MTRMRALLFVDDDPLQLGLYGLIVRDIVGEGDSMLRAVNGREALEVVKAAPDNDWCIFSDVCMPEMSGLDFFYALGEMKPPINARKILISSSHVSLSCIEACGAERLLVKGEAETLTAIRSVVSEFLAA